jgi:hypothetical protein
MARVIDLGGRYFQPAEVTTARQDGWVMVQVAEAGLDKFAGKKLDEDIAHEVIVQAFRSGKMFHLLAGMLVECDVKWTPAIAEQNAEYLAELTDPASKRAIEDAFVEVLVGFFLSAPISSAPSPSVSTEAAPARRPRRKRARPSTKAAMVVTGAA